MEKQVKKITLRLPEQLHEALKNINFETGIPIHSLVLTAICHHLNIF